MSKSGWDKVQRTLTYPVDRPGETEQCHPEQGQRRFWDIAASAGMISIDCEASSSRPRKTRVAFESALLSSTAGLEARVVAATARATRARKMKDMGPGKEDL
jgi:hypothetical protein